MKPTTRKTFGLFSLFAAAAMLLTSATTFRANPDFSGSWTRNDTKSELGQYGAMMGKTMKVTADANGLTIARAASGMGGEATTLTDKITFDGKESESDSFGGSKKKSTAKWSDDGQTLTITSTTMFDMQGTKMEIKGSETWKLANGSLEVSSSVSSATFPEMKTKMVYDKAN